MSDNSDGKLDGHVYDGIQENDYPLPTWWTWSFLLTIIFGALYMLHYLTGSGPGQSEEFAMAMERNEKLRSSSQATTKSSTITEEELLALVGDESKLKLGADQFGARCAVCHGQSLEGVIGPNLTDEYWLHGGGTASDILKYIRQGIPEKGMPAWDNVMKPDEIVAVAVFIQSKLGSNPAGAKPPQGEKIVR